MTTNFRVLCAQLLAAVEHQHGDPSIDRLALSRRARAALAEGDGVGPTDDELLELMPETMRDEFSYAAQVCSNATGDKVKPGVFRVCLNTAALEHARAVLARYGTHPRPIPVSERLPTEADCDAEGRCWWLTCGSEATAPYWYLADCEYPARAFPFDPSAWLPAAAIPLPEASP